MDQSLEIKFKTAVEHIFNNWTALQLAVEHSMGGPTSHQIAVEAMTWVCEYCLGLEKLDVDDITEALEDILDEEFSTVCEDNSPKEVAQWLVKFLTLLRQGSVEQFDADFKNLPTCKVWLSKDETPAPKIIHEVANSSENDTSKSAQDMEVDPEWTVVHNRRKK
ncbi:uncharacterized protein CBL_09023 [Carabus blaptoides fortunei]